MIITGIITAFLGIILYIAGKEQNNDLDKQMESIFNDGVANPGSSEETFGMVLLIIGAILVLVGVVVLINKKEEESSPEPQIKTVEANKGNDTQCAKCGSFIPKESKFCEECGAKVGAELIVCSGCGANVSDKAKFCMNCGTIIKRDD